MLGIVAMVVLQDQASIHTLLYMRLNVVSLLFRSKIGPPAYLMPYKVRLQLEIHVD